MSQVALLLPQIDRIGGAERQVTLLAKGLLRRGWRVSVVALSGSGGQAAAELTAAGTAFLTLEMRKGLADPRGWIRFHRWLSRERPDVVHAHLPHAAWLARWSRLAAPGRANYAPVWIDTLHSSSTGSVGRRLGYRFSRWLPDWVTAVSEAVADAHLAAEMVSAGRLSVIHNGVDTETWRPDAAVRAATRGEVGLMNEFVWLAAGRLEPVKDNSTLLRAMADVPEPARLLIAGSGPLEGELRKLAKELGIELRVRFLGFQVDVLRLMQAADAFALSSLWEGLPMGLLEAGACALPAVASDVPGTREVVNDGQTGWLTPPGDASALAAAMTAMMQASPEERRAMGVRARQRVVERFSMEAVLDQWEQLYGNLLTERSRELSRQAQPA